MRGLGVLKNGLCNALLAALVGSTALLAGACSQTPGSTEEVEQQQQQSSVDEAKALPDCDDVTTAGATGTPTIRQVSGSDSLYVLVVGEIAICAGNFGDVADSTVASKGLVYDTSVWAGSNPMPGRGGSNPMPGTSSSGSSESPDSPSGSNPMPGKDSKGR